MIRDPSTEIQTAVYAALVGQGVCGGKVFHRVPANQPLPFCLIGTDDIEGDSFGGDDFRAEVNLTIYAASLPSAKQEFAKVIVALYGPLDLADFTVAEWSFVRSNYTTQPDGQTEQCSATFEYLIISNQQ